MGRITLEEITNQPAMWSEHVFPWRKILGRFHENWHWFTISSTLCIAISLVFLRYKTPEYKISASLLVKDDTKGSDFGDAIALESLGLPSGKSNVDNEVEILKSRSLTESVVNDLQLYIQYFAEGDVKTTEIYETAPVRLELINPQLTSLKSKVAIYTFADFNKNNFKLTSENKSWKGQFGDTLILPQGPAILHRSHFPIVSENKYSIKISGSESTVKKYSHALSVTAANKMVSMINLVMTDILPEKGERVLTRYIKNYLTGSVSDKNRIADSTIAFIDQNLRLVSGELLSVEKEIEGFRKRNHIADMNELSRLLVNNSGQNKLAQSEMDVQLSVIESLQLFLKENPQRVIPAVLGLSEASFGQLIDKYNELQLAKSSQMKTATAEHPEVRNLDRNLADLRENINSGIQAKKEALQISSAQLKKNASRFEMQIDMLPAKERIFLDYARQQQIKQELYIFLLKKRVETSLSKSSTLANGRIIDAPKADSLPFTPSRQLIILLAILTGLALPGAFIYAREILNTRVSGKSDIVQYTHAPILAEIGHNAQTQINIFNQANQQIAEQFRVLRTNLQFLNTTRNQVIMLTSGMGGEGKSFVAINLAISFTLTGKRVILLEFDFRKPKISTYLKLQNKGITDYLISDKYVERFIQKSDISDLFDILTCGLIPPNPAELMLLPKVHAMLESLKKTYDHIILDTAPIGIVTDARILSQYADITLYVVRQQVTYKEQLNMLETLYKNQQLPKLNVLLNDVKTSPGYSYSYGYHLENKKKSLIKRLINR